METDDDLCSLFVNFYNSMREKGVTFIPNSAVAVNVMTRVYNRFVKYGELIKIEDLPKDEKMELVNECREMKGVFYTNESLIMGCKILHVIKLINQKK